MKYAIVRSYLESLEMLACGKSWQWNKRQGTETGRQFCRECQDLWHKQNTWSGKSLVTRRKNMRIWGGHGTRITRDDLAKTGVKDWGMIAGMMLRCAGDWTTRVWTGAPCPDIRQTGEQNRNTRERERSSRNAANRKGGTSDFNISLYQYNIRRWARAQFNWTLALHWSNKPDFRG